MAKKINYTDLVNQPSFQSGLETLEAMKKVMTDIVALSGKTVSGGVPENAAGLKDYTKSVSACEMAQKSLEKIEQQRILLQSRAGKSIEDLKVKNADLNQTLKARAKEEQAVAGSITKMSLELARLRKEYDNLSPAMRQNAAVGKDLLKQINGLDSQLKKLDESVGRHNRNVGNYSNSIQDAVGKLGFLNKYTELAEKATLIYNIVLEISNNLFKKKKIVTEEVIVAEAAETVATETNTVASTINTAAKETQVVVEKSLKTAEEAETVATEANTVAKEANKAATLGWIAVGIAAIAVLTKYIFSFEGASDKLEQWTAGIKAYFKTMSFEIADASMEYTKAMQEIEDEENKHILKIAELRASAQEARLDAMESDVYQIKIDKLKEFEKLSDESFDIEIEHMKKIAEAEKKLSIQYILENKEGQREQIKKYKEAEAAVADLEREKAQRKMRTAKQILSAETDASNLELKLKQDAERLNAERIQDELDRKQELLKLSYKNELDALKEQQRKLGDADGTSPEHAAERNALYKKYLFDKENIYEEWLKKHIQNIKKLEDKDETAATGYRIRMDEIDKKAEDEAIARRKKIAEDEKAENAKRRDDALNAIEDYEKQVADKKQRQYDREIDSSKRHQDLLKEMAARGNQDAQNNLAMEEAKEIQLQAKKEKAIQKQKQIEAGLAILKDWSKNLETSDNATKALTKTLTDAAVMSAALKAFSFFEGTEDTGSGGNLDSKGGFLAVLHPKEAVLNKEENDFKKSLGYDNTMLLQAAAAHKADESLNEKWQTNEMILRKFDELKAEIKNKPVYMGNEYDKDSHTLIEMIEQGSSLVRNHKRQSKLA